jgi:hypothetical protein
MRHTVLEFPGDPRSAKAHYQYLLGQEMLVAPVIEPGAELRTLYLPPEEWANFWKGDFLTGGQDVTVVASTDTIPILVRDGSILPFKPAEEAAGAGRTRNCWPARWSGKPAYRKPGPATKPLPCPTEQVPRFEQHGSGAMSFPLTRRLRPDTRRHNGGGIHHRLKCT